LIDCLADKLGSEQFHRVESCAARNSTRKSTRCSLNTLAFAFVVPKSQPYNWRCGRRCMRRRRRRRRRRHRH